MAIPLVCECGAAYQFRPEFAGQRVRCNQCQAVIDVPLPGPGQTREFGQNKYLINQKVLSVASKYTVSDEQGQPLLYVVRPIHFWRNLLAVLGALPVGMAAAAIGGGITYGLLSLILSARAADYAEPWTALIAGITFFAVFAVTAIALSAKRHVLFYRDEQQSDLLLKVEQDRKWFLINATYTVVDAAGTMLARLRKNYLFNLIRKRWVCEDPEGREICRALEDSILLSLLRRVLGTFFGLLRINFIFVTPDERTIGEFNRKFTLRDRYVLDFSADSGHELDRRIGLAIGVMLDTGERR